MKKWKDVRLEKPTTSGVYQIKADWSPPFTGHAYFSMESGRWIEDDAWWLPVDVTNYITHWSECNLTN